MFSLFKNDKISNTASRMCSDCQCKIGELHELFCTKELCPFCHSQLAACGCIHKELNLTPEESEAVDEYIDDFEEPLKSIVSRWEKAVIKKGRIPFGKDLEILNCDV